MIQHSYEVIEEKAGDIVNFFFFSKGKRDIAKAIEYSYAGDLPDGKRIYNLAFGDYDFVTGEMNDSNNSNNEDQYKVFNTVLNSINNFLDKNQNCTVMVQGSDSGLEFIKKCKLTCIWKKCNTYVICRKKKRRINIYRGYINKNWKSLNVNYAFFDGNPLYTKLTHIDSTQLTKHMIVCFVTNKNN